MSFTITRIGMVKMKNKQQYFQELKDLMLDLSESVDSKDDEKVNEILSLSSLIIDDIREAEYE